MGNAAIFFSSLPDNSEVITDKTNFGVLVAGDSFTNQQKSDIATSLNCGYVRMPIVMTLWTGTQPTQYTNYAANGFKIVLNINYGSPAGGMPVPFPTDMTAYAATLNDILDTLTPSPDLIVIENEEINPQYHVNPDANMGLYVTMLQTAGPIIHGRGLKFANGGIYGLGLNCSVFRYLKATYGQTRADQFGHAAMNTFGYNAANNVGSQPTVETLVNTITTIKNGIISSGADYFNVHPYSPYGSAETDPGSVTLENPYIYNNIYTYLTGSTGAQGMSNETGQRDNSIATLVTSVMQQVSDAGAKYCVWYSGDDVDNGTVALNNTDGTLRDTGDAFAEFLNEYNI